MENLTEALSGLSGAADVASLGGVAGIVQAVGSNLTDGLTPEQVVANREKFGKNRLPAKIPRSFFSHLMDAFEDTTLKILVVSALFSIGFGVFVSKTRADIAQGFAILTAIVIVSGVNSFQNWRKDREFQTLAKIKADRAVQVVRGGKEASVSIYDLVVGDIVVLASGDGLPADGLLGACGRARGWRLSSRGMGEEVGGGGHA
jgi:P-type Ca2+ transporter type 2C